MAAKLQTSEQTISPPPEHLSEIIFGLEQRIKEFEKNTVPKYINEVHELKDRLASAEAERLAYRVRLNDCLAKMAELEKKSLPTDSARVRDLEAQVAALTAENAKVADLMSDNRLLAREIERYENCICEATMALEKNNLTVLTFEQENQHLKIQLREKLKESSNLREQLSEMVETQAKLRNAIQQVEQLSSRIEKELDDATGEATLKHSEDHASQKTDGTLTSELKVIEVLLEKYSKLRSETCQNSTLADNSLTHFHASQNFYQASQLDIMKKTPSVPILNSKMIAQLRQAKVRDLNSAHSSMRLPESKTQDSDCSQREVIQKILATDFENRRLSNALSITSKQYNAANLENKELTQELNDLKTSLVYVLEARSVTESQYGSQISHLQSQLAQAKGELNATISHLEQEIAAKTKLSDELKLFEDDRQKLASEIDQLKRETSQERERSLGIIASREKMARQLQKAQHMNQDLKMMIHQREQKIRELSTKKPPMVYLLDEKEKQKMKLSLKNFNQDIYNSLLFKKKLNKERDSMDRIAKNRSVSPAPAPIVLSRLEMVKELKVRLDLIQKINAN